MPVQICIVLPCIIIILIQCLSMCIIIQSGEIVGNQTAGRKLMEAISCIPLMDEMKFEAILNSTMQVMNQPIYNSL